MSSHLPAIPTHSVAIQPLLSGNDLLAALLLSTILRAPRTQTDVSKPNKVRKYYNFSHVQLRAIIRIQFLQRSLLYLTI